MGKIIEYSQGHIVFRLKLKNNIVESLSKNTLSFIHNGKIYAICYGEKLIDEGTSTNDNDIDRRDLNQNVLCFDLNGKLLWQIQPCLNVQKGVCRSGRKYSIWPYHSLYVENNKLYAACGDLWTYEVNPEDGTVKHAFNSK